MGGCTFTRTVKNVSGVRTNYTIGIEKTDAVEITTYPAGSFSIPANGTQTITIRVTASILSGGAWQFGRIRFETGNTFPSGKPISTTAFTLAVKAPPVGSTFPSELRRNIDAPAGQYVFEDQYYSSPITAFSNVRYGLQPATVESFSLPQDPTRNDVYDDLTDVWYTVTTCPSNQQRLVVEILETTSADLDIYVGLGNTPSDSMLRAFAAGQGPMEYLSLFRPTFSGTCWILVQNWESSETGAEDSVKLAYGFVPRPGGDNYTITGPASVPAMAPFDVTVDWNLGGTYNTAEVWYGWFSLGSSASTTDDIGKLDFNLYKASPGSVYLPILFK